MAKKVRGFLEANKIFFELFAALFLGAVAVYLAFEANLISRQQKETQERQAAIQEKQAAIQNRMIALQTPPSLSIRKSTRRWYAKKLPNPFYVVFNSGGPVYNLDIKKLVFLDIAYGPMTDSTCHFEVLAKNFSVKLKYDGNLQGEVLQLYFEDLQKIVENAKILKKLVETKIITSVVILEVYLMMIYEDVNGKSNASFFRVSSEQGVERITKSVWNKLNNDAKELSKDKVYVRLADTNNETLKKFWIDRGAREITKRCRPIGYPGSERWKQIAD